MGVHGLTTYLRENRRLLATTHTLSSEPGDLTAIVVDGWSFIYDIHLHTSLPWVYGGEYAAFARHVEAVVRAWLQVGFRVYFVFDGPCPRLKFPTEVKRLTDACVQPSLLFFRTSPASRAAPRFLSEARVIPPLHYAACVAALQRLAHAHAALEVHFADEEGDPYAVELAGRVRGFVVGNDSDFAVLNADGYRGYVPLDDMVWAAPPAQEDAAAGADADDFQPVRGKRKPVKSGRSPLPPGGAAAAALTFTAYAPAVLAAHLKIPATLLPLLGSLVGNDFAPSAGRGHTQLLFEHHLTLSQRIARVAATISTILAARRPQQQIGSVMDLIDRTVNALLVRPASTMGSGEVEAIVERIVEATLQYAIPKGGDAGAALWPTAVCALHEPDACTLLPVFSPALADDAVGGEDDEETAEMAQRRTVTGFYLEAYRQGRLSPRIVDVLSTGTFWPRLFLENPDLETVQRSIGRPIREWTYAVLDDALGLPLPADEVTDAPADNEDEDELVDVEEDDSDAEGPDPLAPLRGALQRLHSEDDGDPALSPRSTTAALAPHQARRPVVTEYIRRGTRVAPEPVAVPALAALLAALPARRPLPPAPGPLVLQDAEARLTALLGALRADTPAVRALAPARLVPVLAARAIVQILDARAGEGAKERIVERWTAAEARAFLGAFDFADGPAEGDDAASDDATQSEYTQSEDTAHSHSPSDAQGPPPLADRSVQLAAQALAALEAVEHLAQVLLLGARAPGAAGRFSGRAFHAGLARVAEGGSGDAGEVDGGLAAMVAACAGGIEGAFAEERRVAKGRAKAGKKAGKEVGKGGAGAKKVARGGLFDLLGDGEA